MKLIVEHELTSEQQHTIVEQYCVVVADTTEVTLSLLVCNIEDDKATSYRRLLSIGYILSAWTTSSSAQSVQEMIMIDRDLLEDHLLAALLKVSSVSISA